MIFRARNYDPSTGTFTSKDTYLGDKTDPVTRNRYTYANNNPVAYQDPSGHAGVLNNIVSGVKEFAGNVGATVSKTVNKAGKAVANLGKAVGTVSKEIVMQAASTAKSIVSGFVDGVSTLIIDTAKTITSVVNIAREQIVKTTTAVINKVMGFIGQRFQ